VRLAYQNRKEKENMDSSNLSVHRVNVQKSELLRECTIKLAHGFTEIPVDGICDEAKQAVIAFFAKEGRKCREVMEHVLPHCPCDARQLCQGKVHLQFETEGR
jgi:hypothetical protein